MSGETYLYSAYCDMAACVGASVVVAAAQRRSEQRREEGREGASNGEWVRVGLRAGLNGLGYGGGTQELTWIRAGAMCWHPRRQKR